MELEERLARVLRGTSEVLVESELRDLLARKEHPRAYIGYEPSGPFTIGQLVTIRKILDLEEAGFDVTVFLADWHALINDKLGGSLERITEAGKVMEKVIRALGGGDRVQFRWASDLTGNGAYWSRVIRSAKAMTLARAKRAMTIMGRTESEADVDSAKLFYPAMQVADIFELGVDLAYGGMDQRRAHVLAREVAAKNGWPVPIALHTPLVSSLKGGGRMNPGEEGLMEKKMSKSDASTAAYAGDSEEILRERIKGAFCPARETEGNPVVELAVNLVMTWEGALTIERAEKHGGRVSFSSPELFQAAWKEGKLHPLDLKAAVAESLVRILAPVRALAGQP
ncbi:MAG: tyrosine--tRNA ligase [Candidatus Thermoplasmatota archaeon]|jgi:tyrosyl-tRNA synthetase|nr:tyrosine--tRNA ligase [Candidatus Thermoplasmatota archaeon]MCL5984826.1 tyrosine--tRNA ligase [Candidatus Thermoplasmatota archaeon]